MELTFGAAYTSLDPTKRGPGSLFMETFESCKRNFSDDEHEQAMFEIGPISLNLDVPSMKYDEYEEFVKLSRSVNVLAILLVRELTSHVATRNEMRCFFEAPIAALVEKLDDQVTQLERKSRNIDVSNLSA